MGHSFSQVLVTVDVVRPKPVIDWSKVHRLRGPEPCWTKTLQSAIGLRLQERVLARVHVRNTWHPRPK